MLDLITALVATAVGILIGACGVGGVLLISYLALFTHLSIHQAAATSLFSFLFTGLLGAWLFHRKGSIDWRIALPLCAGALPTSYLGALVAARASTAVLAMIVGLVIVAAGIAMVIARGAGH
ncbi:MAG: sulfite exporter TauE/SafE family protein, partial [Burkholderiales bacterium]|nr:sulfite exporter TauE/SafE family protein [Burkholderiales bacterium]